jgi:hypothetical protein
MAIDLNTWPAQQPWPPAQQPWPPAQHEKPFWQLSRYVPTATIKSAIEGREAELLRLAGVSWPPPRGVVHINCPYPDHPDRDPSWRIADDGLVFCSAGCPACKGRAHSAFDALVHLDKAADFEEAKLVAAELLDRTDLIVEPHQGVTIEQLAAHKKLPVEFLRQQGLTDGHHKGGAAVRIPYFDDAGGEIDPRWRIRLEGGPGEKKKKTVSPYGGKTALYGRQRKSEAIERGFVIMPEGESDCWALRFHSWPCIGMPGATNFSDKRDADWFEGIPQIFVIKEPDQGGEGMVEHLAGMVIAPRVKVIKLPVKDASELHCTDPDNFDAVLQAAIDNAEPIPADAIEREQRALALAEDRRSGEVLRDGYPTIATGGGMLSYNIDSAERLLIEALQPIFQFGDRLVRVARGPILAAVGHQKIEVFGARTIEMTNMALRDELSRHINFTVYDVRSKKDRPINCPADIAEGLLHRVGRWEFPVLTGIISTPVIRPDQSLVDKIGWDAATGLYLAPGEAAIPELKAEPTREDALGALDYLMHPLREVPFTDDASKSVVLSGILTALDRPMLDFAPIHAIDAPQAGSGKGLLCNYISIIASGHEAPAVMANDDPTETDKSIAAKLMQGHSTILLDNVTHPLESALLAQLMTQGSLDLRVLGQSRTVTVPNSAFVMINGNNLALLGDLPRRSLKSRLDARHDKPELRVFKSEHPLAVARRDRPMLVAAGLTILLAFRRAGSPTPDGVTPLGSFEMWSDHIRNAIIWLGVPDPVKTQDAIRSVNRKHDAHLALMAAWLAAHPSATGDATVMVTARRLIELAGERQQGDAFAYKHPELRDALLSVAGSRSGRDIDATRLGQFLARNVDVAAGDMRIEKDDVIAHGGGAMWRVAKLKP